MEEWTQCFRVERETNSKHNPLTHIHQKGKKGEQMGATATINLCENANANVF